MIDGRKADHAIHNIFLRRWSPRAFSDEPIPVGDLLTILEAARWAPSAFNTQPWRFIYARRGGPAWQVFLSILLPFNRIWAQRAAALVLIYSKLSMRTESTGVATPLRSHAFDAGAAWSNLALQATLMGWHCHAMLGFDYDAALSAFDVSAEFRAEAAIAIGRLGDKSLLDEKLAAREMPSQRCALKELASEGRFPG